MTNNLTSSNTPLVITSLFTASFSAHPPSLNSLIVVSVICSFDKLWAFSSRYNLLILLIHSLTNFHTNTFILFIRL